MSRGVVWDKRAEREVRSCAVGRGAARDRRLHSVFGREGWRILRVEERGQERWEDLVGVRTNVVPGLFVPPRF